LAYIVPFLFAFSPTLLLYGPWTEVTLSVVTAILGTFLLGVALVGYLFRAINPVRRALMMIAALGLLVPIHTGEFATLTWVFNGIALVMGGILMTWEWVVRTPAPNTSTAVTDTDG